MGQSFLVWEGDFSAAIGVGQNSSTSSQFTSETFSPGKAWRDSCTFCATSSFVTRLTRSRGWGLGYLIVTLNFSSSNPNNLRLLAARTKVTTTLSSDTFSFAAVSAL